MCLTFQQVDAIKRAAAEIYGDAAQVWLFGSRVDDQKRGGDIDLLIRSAEGARHGLIDKIRLLGRLELMLGERKIDVVIETVDDRRPIIQIAHTQGIRL
jgi:predicted nucleotidyltransferase